MKMRKILSLALALAMVASFMVAPAFGVFEVSDVTYTIAGNVPSTAINGYNVKLEESASTLVVSFANTGTQQRTGYFILAHNAPSGPTDGTLVTGVASAGAYGTPVSLTLPAAHATPYKLFGNIDGGVWTDTGISVTAAAVQGGGGEVETPANTFKVIYDPGIGATGTIPELVVAENTELNATQLADGLELVGPVDKPIFGGWAKSDALDTPITTLEVTDADVTLTAIWKAIEGEVKSDATITRVAGNAADNTPDLTEGDFYISLATEKLTVPATGFATAAFSLDNGGKWKSGEPTDKDIAKLLKSGGQLVLTDSFDAKAKAPTKGVTAKPESAPDKGDAVEAVVGAILVTFEKIEARPADVKLAVNYGFAEFRDDAGITNGNWTLGAKGATAYKATDVAGLEILKPAGKKPAEGEVYQPFSAYGVSVKNMEDKPVKTTYFVRSKATKADGKITPASKGYKVSASSVTKAPKVKVDYKNEIVKTKAPMNIYMGAALDSAAIAVEKSTKEYLAKSGMLVAIVDKANAVPLNLSEYLGTTSQTLIVWAGASEKKPASQKLVVKLAVRADAPTEDIATDKGKVKLDKTLEVKEKATDLKWAKFPKITKNADVLVRVKSAAKSQKVASGILDDSGQIAASEPSTYKAFYDVYNPDAEKAKQKKGFVLVMEKGIYDTTVEELTEVAEALQVTEYTEPSADQAATETAIAAAYAAKLVDLYPTDDLYKTYTLSYAFSDYTASTDVQQGTITVVVTVSKNNVSVASDEKTFLLDVLEASTPD